ncbi:MAG: cytochrome ubiquinol oxidase subunit I [Desulfobulbaceae bacterium]|nr:cytochrome ubiquinol oxidase subunit I [Desulfobulbaceae bacterium]
MNYPVWQLDAAGGGLPIALMAILHVYISHFAVGGGLFLVVTEMMGIRKNSRPVLDYVKKHTRFFLLLTLVAGSMTGVGIWFTIGTLNPAATSRLIHLFVFAWGIEWVFFTAEILSLFIYYYTFGRMDNRNHVIVGWIYFGCAWMSLFFINGIIDYMLTPGAWPENNSFWSALFNPTFWPALFFRSFLAFMLAGLYGFLTATALKDPRLRTAMVRYCAIWLIAPFLLFLASAWWYRAVLPGELQNHIFQGMPEVKAYLTGFMYMGPILMFGGLVMAIRMPQAITRSIAAVMLIIGLLYMGSFEFIREAGRRPYIIHGYMYSNSILTDDLERVQQQGVLKEAKWIKNRTITKETELKTGRELFNLLCLPCHSIGGPLNDIKKLAGTFTPRGLSGKIRSIHNFSAYMPPFAGTREEADALASYIAYGLNNRRDRKDDISIATVPDATIPPFDFESDKYVLLAWSDLGMKSVTDASNTWMMLPPGVTLNAQLIERGETPDVLVDGITVTYEINRDFADPAARVDFWKNAGALYDREIPENIGLSGNGLSGSMQPGEEGFSVTLLPVFPYTLDNKYMPYPDFTIIARNKEGEILARTWVAAPTATEMNCRTCHGGKWKVAGRAGISRETAEHVLAAHDRISSTNLQAMAAEGRPVLCARCHAYSSPDTPGSGGHLNLSAAMHGFHAVFLAEQGASSCVLCHPADDGGATRAFRGIHRRLDLDCTSCHGEIEDHAISLLKAELENGKDHAADLLHHLMPANFAGMEDIMPRTPWINEPDCLHCHVDFEPPDNDTTFNQWTPGEEELYRNRTDESGRIRCAACHGSPHAIFPARNPYNSTGDIIQPMQYQQSAYPIGSNRQCKVCHTIDMDDEMHHGNIIREFRNK